MTALAPVRVAVVGHVDHGKSTLVGRLFYEAGAVEAARLPADNEWAFLIDQFQEERERAMTLDTAQAFFSTGRRTFIVIDTPGHRELLRNMITGATRSDVAVLVIAADEGIREQTRCHASVLGLVGIKRVVIVINKMDVVGYAEERF